MQFQTFKPGPQYATRMRLVITIVALLVLAGAVLLGLIIAIDNKASAMGILLTLFIPTMLAGVVWLVAILLTGPYYRSLSYEIQDDEVIVRAGIWTKSVKHVPYRTVTNLTVKRDVLDRLMGLGTLRIQTAGMSGQTGAEETLVGLTNVQEVYDLVATELRRFRGGMAPTQAEVEAIPGEPPADPMQAILAEVRAIRQAMETK
jgi:uncharacterized membrane protein YdbT with pleckstrin-like domain